jgi:beta-glucosidase
MPWKDAPNLGAIVMGWYPGQQGGAALASLLFGDSNFGGRLPVTWPKKLEDFPPFTGRNGNPNDSTTYMDYYLGYHWFDHNGTAPLYAFGHGLSYSTFKYERLHIPCSTVTTNGLIQVEVDVRNTSAVAGDEVVQVYVSYPDTTGRRNAKELKGFARVNLAAGQAKRVSIPIRVRDLKYWDMRTGAWVTEKAPVKVQVGPASDQLLLSQTFSVN